MRGRSELRTVSPLVAVMAAVLAFCLPAAAYAQEGYFEEAGNPFQTEPDFTINTELTPQVEVDGVRWMRFTVRTKEGREIAPDRITPVFVELDLFNTIESARVLVIVLFEDENGNPLDRIECPEINVGRERLREAVQKHKVDGSVLLATRKVYLLFEVLR